VMNLYLDNQILEQVEAQTVRDGLLTIFQTAFAVNTGIAPAPLLQPPMGFRAYPGDPVDGQKIAFITQAGNDFVAVNKEFNIQGLQPFGRPGIWLNSCLVYSTMGIQNTIGQQYNVGPPSAPFTVTSRIAAHLTSYTVAHELGWHVIGDHGGEGDPNPTIHIGVNDWAVLINGGFILNGRFPGFLDGENRRLQKQMGYIR